MENHEKEMAKMRRKNVLSKTSAINEFKSLNEYKEAMEGAISSQFGKGFDLCKKQIGILHPNLDIKDLQINPNLVEEEEDMPNANLP